MTVALRVCSVLAAPTTADCKTGTCIQGIPRGFHARLLPPVNEQLDNSQGSDGSVGTGAQELVNADQQAERKFSPV